MSDKQQCSACRYYKPRPKDLVNFANSLSTFPAVAGFCNRFPPVLIDVRERMGSSPGVPEDHWCGEYAQIPTQEVPS